MTISNMRKNIKNIQHSHDATRILKDINSLNIAITTVEEFNSTASSKVNLSKTQYILLGSLK